MKSFVIQIPCPKCGCEFDVIVSVPKEGDSPEDT